MNIRKENDSISRFEFDSYLDRDPESTWLYRACITCLIIAVVAAVLIGCL